MNELPKRYNTAKIERKWMQYWQDEKIYRFQPDQSNVYSIDTPPPTVSGDLHLGHCYSYSQTDFYARFQRMNGKSVFYPMGWDDNGLPTERLIEKSFGITLTSSDSEAFLHAIAQTSRELEQNYEQLWRRLGLSIDWNYTYTTISPTSRKIAQLSFLNLFKKERVYRSFAPTVWCPFCKTAIAHAELEDKPRKTEMITIKFKLDDGQDIPIATTRPELLPACVAVFVNPDDVRYRHLIGRKVKSPVFGKEVPVMSDPKADPQKGTGIVMCCTFGDTTDIKWRQEYHLPSIGIIGTDGLMNQKADFLAGLDIKSAKGKMIRELSSQGLVLDKHDLQQTVSVHDRCDTPAEYIETQQWFIRVLDHKEQLLEAGRRINWHPGYMLSRYTDWVEHLEWDWCISRQRHHGVPFPLWYCTHCGEVVSADVEKLPVDPRQNQPSSPCRCGSREFVPETSVMDTWATSSLSPQIAGHWQAQDGVFDHIFPMSLRPQAHDIVRTWAFYTIVMSLNHFGRIPWSEIAISGHGLSPEGHKVSKSKIVNIIAPLQMMEKYSADAVRYWATGSRLGEDSIINEEKFAAGQRLVTKLWNAASFSYPFIGDYIPPAVIPELVFTDKWVLSRLQGLIMEVTQAFSEYDHANAKNRIESFFWDIITDNYLEMAKNRLYSLVDGTPEKESARYTLYHAIFTIIKMLAPLLPYITEEIFASCLKRVDSGQSIHQVTWPQASMELIDTHAEAIGLALVEIATTARRFKSENKISLGAPLARIVIASPSSIRHELEECRDDIKSVTRAREVDFTSKSIEGKDALDNTVEVTIIEEE